MKVKSIALIRTVSIMFFIIFVAVVLTGCAGKLIYQSEPMIAGSPYAEREDALGVLLNQAFHAIDEGQLDEAGGWLSRAMRINPAEPVIYYHMAEIRKEQGDIDQTRQLAGRALSLGPGSGLTTKLKSLLKSLES